MRFVIDLDKKKVERMFELMQWLKDNDIEAQDNEHKHLLGIGTIVALLAGSIAPENPKDWGDAPLQQKSYMNIGVS